VVCDPQRNAWIARDEFNDDKTSAIKLARPAPGRIHQEIRHPDDAGAQLRGLVFALLHLNQQLTRL